MFRLIYFCAISKTKKTLQPLFGHGQRFLATAGFKSVCSALQQDRGQPDHRPHHQANRGGHQEHGADLHRQEHEAHSAPHHAGWGGQVGNSHFSKNVIFVMIGIRIWKSKYVFSFNRPGGYFTK